MSNPAPAANPPVILLAFANPYLRDYAPLEWLIEEARELRAILQPAARAGRCDLLEIPNATLQEVLDAFQDPYYRGRIAIFHFAGHGGSDKLLLEERTGTALAADAGGIAAFLARQPGLKLVFLNACSTAEQVESLHAACVPAVVAMDIDVSDEWARAFAVRFYKGLAGGSALASAYGEAEAEMQAQYGGNKTGETWPWRLHLSAEADGAWKLPARKLQPGGLVPMQKPLRAQHFIGRDKELKKLLADLHPGKIVTLCGPGGMGKSALAAEVVWRLAPGDEPPPQFPDGILFHTFYHQPQVDQALEAIARAYGVDPQPTPRDAARQALAGKRALLLLDGAEAANDLEAVLAVAGTCGVLVTTRRHEDALDEYQDIEPLPRPESLELLSAWAGRYAADTAAANEIVRLLGGLPLALFLAGRYLVQKRQQASDYVAWLEGEGLGALHFGERPKKSIPVLMRSSLDGVSTCSRAAFGVAGMLALAPFQSELIAVALELTPHVADRALGELVDYGLLLRPDDSYQVTHALAHNFAAAQVERRACVIERLALHCAEIATRETERGPSGFAILDRQRAHIIAVQAAARNAEQWEEVRQITWKMKDYLDLRGYTTDRIAVILAGLYAAYASNHRGDQGSFLTALGNVYANLGETRHAIKLYKQRLAVARKSDDRRGEGIALGNLGLANADLGRPRIAIEFYEQALTIIREIGDRRGEGITLINLGLAYADLGQPRIAIKLYERGLVIDREIGDRRGEGADLGNMGSAYSELGETRRAIELYEQQLAIVREIGDRRGESCALGNLGSAYSDLGEMRCAIEFYEQALALDREIGDRRGEGADLGNLGNAYRKLNATRRAIELYKQALTIVCETGDRQREAITSWNLGLAYAEEGIHAQAIAHMQVSVDYEREIGHPDAETDAEYVAELSRS